MKELHRLTLRQINENPTLMSDEVFVPAEDVDALVAKLQELRKEIDEFDELHIRLRKILVGTANALKGEPEPLHSHSWHDLAEVAASAIAAVQAQHGAIDRLFAILIAKTMHSETPFFPSESGPIWEAAKMGKAVLDAAGVKP